MTIFQSSGAKTPNGFEQVIAREIDRINRTSQKSTTLDERVHKLRALAEYVLIDNEGNIKEEYEEWIHDFEKGAARESKVPIEVRWKQLRLLVRLFRRENVFDEDDVNWKEIDSHDYHPEPEAFDRQ